MKTNIKKTSTSTIISVNGRLSFETQDDIRNEILNTVDQLKTDSIPKNLIFNLENLQFVGSSGISKFAETLKEANIRYNQMAKIANVGSEFEKIFRAYDLHEDIQFIEKSTKELEH